MASLVVVATRYRPWRHARLNENKNIPKKKDFELCSFLEHKLPRANSKNETTKSLTIQMWSTHLFEWNRKYLLLHILARGFVSLPFILLSQFRLRLRQLHDIRESIVASYQTETRDLKFFRTNVEPRTDANKMQKIDWKWWTNWSVDSTKWKKMIEISTNPFYLSHLLFSCRRSNQPARKKACHGRSFKASCSPRKFTLLLNLF